jgi:hypothetical protein
MSSDKSSLTAPRSDAIATVGMRKRILLSSYSTHKPARRSSYLATAGNIPLFLFV